MFLSSMPVKDFQVPIASFKFSFNNYFLNLITVSAYIVINEYLLFPRVIPTSFSFSIFDSLRAFSCLQDDTHFAMTEV